MQDLNLHWWCRKLLIILGFAHFRQTDTLSFWGNNVIRQIVNHDRCTRALSLIFLLEKIWTCVSPILYIWIKSNVLMFGSSLQKVYFRLNRTVFRSSTVFITVAHSEFANKCQSDCVEWGGGGKRGVAWPIDRGVLNLDNPHDISLYWRGGSSFMKGKLSLSPNGDFWMTYKPKLWMWFKQFQHLIGTGVHSRTPPRLQWYCIKIGSAWTLVYWRYFL